MKTLAVAALLLAAGVSASYDLETREAPEGLEARAPFEGDSCEGS